MITGPHDPDDFPLHARLAGLAAQAEAGAALLAWLPANGLRVCAPNARSTSFSIPAGYDPDEIVLRWLGIDPAAFQAERRRIDEDLEAERIRQVRAAAAAPLNPAAVQEP